MTSKQTIFLQVLRALDAHVIPFDCAAEDAQVPVASRLASHPDALPTVVRHSAVLDQSVVLLCNLKPVPLRNPPLC